MKRLITSIRYAIAAPFAVVGAVLLLIALCIAGTARNFIAEILHDDRV